jgi:adenosylcobyric acid synthase
MEKTKALMVVGTSSFAGKTLIVAALCRIFRDRGYKVAPFKGQNMSLNSAVTGDGKEISRAQVMQAAAAGVKSRSEMNPILLKPKGEGVSQVVLNGRPYRDMSANEYYESFVKETGKEAVKSAFEVLSSEFEIIVMEGAGSPAEINLYDKDIANFSAAEMAEADVILVADIERGGAFASIYGTLGLLNPEHRQMVKGIVINKFRGDESLLERAIQRIEELVGVPVIGVVPYLEGLRLPQEDSQALGKGNQNRVDIAILRLPRISNFTDFDPMAFDKRVNVRYVSRLAELKSPDALIIPGTKSTIDDLGWLKKEGFDSIIKLKGKIPIIGICGGFQMLGKRIFDKGVEKGKTSVEGLGLLEIETSFESYDKTTRPVSGEIIAGRGLFEGMKGAEVSGYEIQGL